ncbi:zinc finger protein [Saccharopolyspora oryzae]|uniref:zinc finger protein n=1 Tax=Saccharopolyspora oryzae TaxID=2997343 RepID=UPI002FDBEBC4
MPKPPADPSKPPKTGYWTGFGYQNHVIPTEDPRHQGRDLVALCGVMTTPEDLNPRDDRPTCSVCATEVRTGRVVISVMFD